jgi:hypothetical protein
MLKRAGASVQLQVVPGAGHGDNALGQGLLTPAIDFIAKAFATAPAASAGFTVPAAPSPATTSAAPTAPAPATPIATAADHSGPWLKEATRPWPGARRRGRRRRRGSGPAVRRCRAVGLAPRYVQAGPRSFKRC